MVLEVIHRQARVGRRRLRSRDFRESIVRLEQEAFCKEVARIVEKVEKKLVAKALVKTGIDLARAVISLTPVKTGRARAGWLAFPARHGMIRAMKVGGTSEGKASGRREGSVKERLGKRFGNQYIQLINSVPHIMTLEVGSRPHVIRAGPGKALRFIGRDGGYVFRKQVNHPGTRAYRPLRRSMRHMRRSLRQSFAGLHEGV